MIICYDLDNGVPIGQEDDFQKFCDEQNARRRQKIEDLKDPDYASLTLMEMESLKIKVKDLEKESAEWEEKFRDNVNDVENMIENIENIMDNDLKNNKKVSLKLYNIIEEYRNAPYYRIEEKLKKFKEENNWN